MIFGLPNFLIPPPPPEPVAVSVELLPISAISNIKPSEKPPAPEPEKKPDPTPPPPKPPAPPVKTAENTPPPPPKEDPLKVKKEEKKPELKKEEPKKEEKKEKAKEEDLDAILKAVKKSAQQQQKEEDKKAKKEPPKDAPASKSISSQYDESLPMSMSEKDAIRSQFAKCWSVPAGAKDAHSLIVVLEISVEMDGRVSQVKLASASQSRYNSDQFYRAAADSAMRAVHQCSPLKNLPVDKYGTWKQMELTFDPKEMLF